MKKETDLYDLSEMNYTKLYCASYQIHQINPFPVDSSPILLRLEFQVRFNAYIRKGGKWDLQRTCIGFATELDWRGDNVNLTDSEHSNNATPLLGFTENCS